jgi:hypothetical protein
VATASQALCDQQTLAGCIVMGENTVRLHCTADCVLRSTIQRTLLSGQNAAFCLTHSALTRSKFPGKLPNRLHGDGESKCPRTPASDFLFFIFFVFLPRIFLQARTTVQLAQLRCSRRRDHHQQRAAQQRRPRADRRCDPATRASSSCPHFCYPQENGRPTSLWHFVSLWSQQLDFWELGTP